ncbi:hypothetical protein A5745_14730 [Mycobacterium sp. IS-2888]|nr:hypothetical protein A5745_14730 [Mycobacterium sp. IS-2888]
MCPHPRPGRYENVFKKWSESPPVLPPTYDNGPPGAETYTKEHLMTTDHDFDPTALAPRGEEPTAAYAWASSPLGDPTDSASHLPSEHEFPLAPDQIAPEPQPKSINKTMVAAGLIGLISAGTALGIALSGGSSQPQHVAVADHAHAEVVEPVGVTVINHGKRASITRRRRAGQLRIADDVPIGQCGCHVASPTMRRRCRFCKDRRCE